MTPFSVMSRRALFWSAFLLHGGGPSPGSPSEKYVVLQFLQEDVVNERYLMGSLVSLFGYL